MKTSERRKKDKEYLLPKRSLLEIQKITKGIANHTRIQVVNVLQQQPGLTLDQITELLNGNFKTISGHIKRLSEAGLVWKKYNGNFVQHTLTEEGKKCAQFLKSFN